MQPDNPYSAPRVELVDALAGRPLPGWSSRQLRVLGWLALAAVLGNALVLLLLLGSAGLDEAEAQRLTRYTDWLSLLLVLLGCYLLIRLKAFAEQRFAAKRLAWPIWILLLASLALGLMDFLVGERLFDELDGQTIAYLGLLVPMGCSTAWVGVRLLKVAAPYPSLRAMAWLDIVGGLMLASLLLMLLAVVPLLGAGLALMLVFFKGAAELRGLGA